MNGDTVLMVIKTLYGVVGYSGSMLLAVIWIGIALAYFRIARGMGMWLLLLLSMSGYAGLFLMLGIIASGNPLFGMEINAWFNRTFALIGFIFGVFFTYVYLAHKWPQREQRPPMSD